MLFDIIVAKVEISISFYTLEYFKWNNFMYNFKLFDVSLKGVRNAERFLTRFPLRSHPFYNVCVFVYDYVSFYVSKNYTVQIPSESHP